MTGDELVERLTAEPESSGLFLDFDGTLAPIVEDPTLSEMPDELAPVLADLADSLRLLAVVSGRPADFLADRAAIPGARLLGLYGLQEWTDGSIRPRPEAEQWQGAVDTALDRVETALEGEEGIRVEDKGLSVAVHWRNAEDRQRAERKVERLIGSIADDTGLAREPGKLVSELRPPVDWDKGTAVRTLADELGLRTVVYVGDDRGDLAAFEAVRERDGVAVAVDHGEETPAELVDAADVVLDGTDAVADWLVSLRDALG
ncbi:MAG: trehalose-phosphatase [Actinomycetota bacterium]|nr:trehalose-phosphatase [Actinomycetota bacterium]